MRSLEPESCGWAVRVPAGLPWVNYWLNVSLASPKPRTFRRDGICHIPCAAKATVSAGNSHLKPHPSWWMLQMYFGKTSSL